MIIWNDGTGLDIICRKHDLADGCIKWYRPCPWHTWPWLPVLLRLFRQCRSGCRCTSVKYHARQPHFYHHHTKRRSFAPAATMSIGTLTLIYITVAGLFVQPPVGPVSTDTGCHIPGNVNGATLTSGMLTEQCSNCRCRQQRFIYYRFHRHRRFLSHRLTHMKFYFENR